MLCGNLTEVAHMHSSCVPLPLASICSRFFASPPSSSSFPPFSFLLLTDLSVCRFRFSYPKVLRKMPLLPSFCSHYLLFMLIIELPFASQVEKDLDSEFHNNMIIITSLSAVFFDRLFKLCMHSLFGPSRLRVINRCPTPPLPPSPLLLSSPTSPPQLSYVQTHIDTSLSLCFGFLCVPTHPPSPRPCMASSGRGGLECLPHLLSSSFQLVCQCILRLHVRA